MSKDQTETPASLEGNAEKLHDLDVQSADSATVKGGGPGVDGSMPSPQMPSPQNPGVIRNLRPLGGP